MITVAALSEPDLRKIFEPPVRRDVCGRDVAMVIENGLRAGELEVKLFARRVGEQKILGKKRIIHSIGGEVGLLRIHNAGKNFGQVVRPCFLLCGSYAAS